MIGEYGTTLRGPKVGPLFQSNVISPSWPRNAGKQGTKRHQSRTSPPSTALLLSKQHSAGCFKKSYTFGGLLSKKYETDIQNQNVRLRSHDAGTFWKRWKIRRIGLLFTRKRHIFCRQILKTVDFENGTLTGINLKQHRKQIIFQRFWIETGRFLVCRYISSASKSRNEFLLSIFLPFSNCAGIVWTLAQILQPSHFSPFSKCAGIVWTQSKSTSKRLALMWKFC